LGGEGRQISEFKTSLDYRMSSRTAKEGYTEKPCLKAKQINQPNNNNQLKKKNIKSYFSKTVSNIQKEYRKL
jgi:hypothetical protein